MKQSELTMHLINCPVCGCGSHEPVRILNGYRLVRCRDCRMSYVNPRPDEAAILCAYTGASRGEALSFAANYESNESLEQNYSWCGEYVLNRLAGHRPRARFLDIGAGQGWMVFEAMKRGMDAYGYEFGDGRAFEHDARLLSRIYRTEESIRNSGHKYDILFLSAVLEHVYRPVDFLRHWLPFLKEDGLFCVAAVPNMESIFIRLGVDGWDGNLPPAHLNYFTPATLKQVIRRAGCELKDFYTLGAPLSVSPANFFRQKHFEKPFLKHLDSPADPVRRARAASARSAVSTGRRSVTAAANHLIRFTGTGANLYATFKKA